MAGNINKWDDSFLEDDDQDDSTVVNKWDDSVLEDEAVDPNVSQVTGEATPSEYEGQDLNNFERVGSRVAVQAANTSFGVGEIAARADGSQLGFTKGLIDESIEGEDSFFSIPNIPLAIVNHIGSFLTEGVVDLADMATDGDVRKDLIEANEIVRDEAAKALGSKELQYNGGVVEKTALEIAEATVNMVPALAAGWATGKPGVTLAMISQQVAGSTYNEYMEQTGGDHDRSMAASKFAVLSEVLPESIPVMAALRKAKAGEGLSRFLEATLGEGFQESLTEILGSTYSDIELQGMSLKEALLNINWSEVGHAAVIGVGVGAVISTPGTIADIRAGGSDTVDQSDNPAELFKPSHRAGGGQEVQVATKAGKIIPDTYINAEGKVIRDSNAQAMDPEAGPEAAAQSIEYDVAATVEATKAQIAGNQSGIIGSQVGINTPQPEQNITFGEQIDINAPEEIPSIDVEEIETRDILPGAEVESEGTATVEEIDLADDFKEGPFDNYSKASASRLMQKREDLDIIEDGNGGFKIARNKLKGDLLKHKRENKSGIVGSLMTKPPTTVVDDKKDPPPPPASAGAVIKEDVSNAANEAATSPENDLAEPTDAQKESGNYKTDTKTTAWEKIAQSNSQDAKTDWEAVRQPIASLNTTQLMDSMYGKPTNKKDLDLVPIKVDKDGTILDGHHRYAEAVNRGDQDILTIVPTSEPWKGTGKVTKAKTKTEETFGPKKSKPVATEDQQKSTPVDRVKMPHKDVLKRVPELQAAAKKVQSGDMTAKEYDGLVNKHKLISPYKAIPAPATTEEMSNALHKNKADKVGNGSSIPDGQAVGLRLDIPAYRDHDVWVPTVHEARPGKGKSPIAHEATAVMENPTFPEDKQALKVAAGKSKLPSAIIKGSWKSQTEAETIAEAESAMKDPAWVQVGFDPERHSYFYDRETTEPVVSGSKIIQIGGLVLVKDPVYESKDKFLFRRKEELPMDKASRMARAEEQGFDTSITLYHGTYSDFDEFDTGRAGLINFSESREFSEGFGDRVGEYYIRHGKTFDFVNNPKHRAEAVKLFNDAGGWQMAVEQNGAEIDRDDYNYVEGVDQGWEIFDEPETDIMSSLVEAGYETFIYDDADGSTTHAVVDPSQIRRTDAAFDPEKTETPKLLAKRKESYQEMKGRDISYEVEVESTGETYTVTVDAARTMKEMDERIQALTELRKCI